MAPDRRLSHLSSAEFAALRDEGRPMVGLLPVGSVEQHGPLLPLGTDTLLAEGFARETAERWDREAEPGCRGVILPSINYTNTDTALDFPGTVSAGHEVQRAYLDSVLRSALGLGLAAVAVVNAHGTNDPFLTELAFRLNREQIESGGRVRPILPASLAEAMAQAYLDLGGAPGRHADWLEVCLAYHLLGPELIAGRDQAWRLHQAASGPLGPSILGTPMKTRSPGGVLGRGWLAGEEPAELAPRAWRAVFDRFGQALDQALAVALKGN